MTYDPGCVSINTLIGSGFDDKNALWMDMYCRRSGLHVGSGDQKERFLPIKHVEKPLLTLHVEWAQFVLRSTTATILVIFGKPNQLFFEKLWKDRLEEVILWDRQQTKFYILKPSEYAEPSRLVFFVWHPEYLTQRKDPDTGKTYDKQLSAIAQMAGIHQSAEQQRYQEDVSQGLRDKYHDTHGASLSRAARLGVLKRKPNAAKEKKGLKMRSDATIEVQCHKCGFVRLDTTPYFIQKGGEEFYVASSAYCPVCAENEGKTVGDGLARWYIPTDSLPWVKDDPRYLTRTSADIKQYAEAFSGPGSDNVAGLDDAVDAINHDKPMVKKRLPRRGDKGGRRPPDYTQPRAFCYHIEPVTQEACTASYTQLGSLKGHFTGKHPKATWDKSLVVWKVGQDSDADKRPTAEASSESRPMPTNKATPVEYFDDDIGDDDETPEDTAAARRRAAARGKRKRPQS